MKDSTFVSIVKSISAAIGSCLLGWLFFLSLFFVYAWVMDFNLFSFHILGIPIILIIALIPIAATVFLSHLFKNRIACGIFCIITTIWLIVTIVEFWIFITHFGTNDSDIYKASTITLIMIPDILGLLGYAFTQELSD